MENTNNYINTLRRDYSKHELDESHVDKNPLAQFDAWFKDAVKAEVHEPNAMVLSTVSSERKPSARVLLLRGFNEKGFVFYSNYNSRKGMEMEQNPYAAMTFYWQEIERQVRIEGKIEKQEEEKSTDYFNSRPRESKIGAWTSPQSKIIKSRSELDIKYAELTEKYKNGEVLRPPFWGGYYLKPSSIEFWQGRPSRLHDRILYTFQNNDWKIERLAP